jgi:ABC-type Fe3+-hydroxamate transport system substrate-binding protein
MGRLALVLLLIWGSAATASECTRIVSQSPYITHSIEWLGLDRCLVGVSRYDKRDLPKTGGVLDPDRKAIARLAPDLILTSDWIGEKQWQAAAPPGARSLRLHGFGAMDEIEDNLRRIGKAAGLQDTEARVKAFSRTWHKLAAQVEGNGRAVVISACGGVPYSFGRKTYIHDLFTASGFQMVDSHDDIRHIKPGEEYESIDALVAGLQPDWLFVLTRADRAHCSAIEPRKGVGVVGLKGEPFFHPAPTLLKGLEELIEQRARWRLDEDGKP